MLAVEVLDDALGVDLVERAGVLEGALDEQARELARLDELAARIASGEGSIGRIMSDPELPEDTRDLGKYLKRHPWKILETPADK